MQHFGKQKRAFNPKWFDQFKFMHYREDSDSVICHTCAVANEQKLLHLDTKREDTFITIGFVNWNKAKEKFQAHSISVTHCHASELLSNPTHIDAIAAEKKEKHTLLDKDSSKCCISWESRLALRRNGDDKSGNFYQLM